MVIKKKKKKKTKTKRRKKRRKSMRDLKRTTTRIKRRIRKIRKCALHPTDNNYRPFLLYLSLSFSAVNNDKN